MYTQYTHFFFLSLFPYYFVLFWRSLLSALSHSTLAIFQYHTSLIGSDWSATPASRWCSRSLYESKCLHFYFIQHCFACFIFCYTDFLPFQLLFSVDYLFIEVLFLFLDPSFFLKSLSPGAFALRTNSRPARPAVSALAWFSLCSWHKRNTEMRKCFAFNLFMTHENKHVGAWFEPFSCITFAWAHISISVPWICSCLIKCFLIPLRSAFHTPCRIFFFLKKAFLFLACFSKKSIITLKAWTIPSKEGVSR